MSQLTPLFVDERTAASLFCMSRKEFCELVQKGHLPAATTIGGLCRWDVSELVQIARGEKARPDGGIEL